MKKKKATHKSGEMMMRMAMDNMKKKKRKKH